MSFSCRAHLKPGLSHATELLREAHASGAGRTPWVFLLFTGQGTSNSGGNLPSMVFHQFQDDVVLYFFSAFPCTSLLLLQH